MNLAAVIEPHPADAVALISRGRTTTYGDLRTQVAAVRGGLSGLGLDPGDRVAIVCANNWYFVVSYLAVLGAGCVAVPLNPLSPPRELERELAAVGARALIAGPSARSAVEGIDRSRLPVLEFVIRCKSPVGDDLRLEDLLAHDPVPIVERGPEDLAVLMFTSGTAGSPKAAMLSHGNLLANIEQVIELRGDQGREDELAFCVLPLFHIFGLNVVLGATLSGGASLLLVERFDPTSAAEAIQNHRVSVVAGAPSMWATWAATPGITREHFASVEIATSGASRLEPSTARQVLEQFGLEIHEGYGLTEASPVVAATFGLPWRPGSIGAPVDRVEVRLVDADGDDVLVGDPGELWVRGPNVFQGYWNDPEATHAAVTDDGWLRTGDIAVVDDEGLLYLVDRAKDLVIVSGFNVYPAEVEEVILQMDQVADCAVVGVPHPHTGEAVKAFVVPEPAHSLDEDLVIEHCATQLARYKCPQKVNFVDELPVNRIGKVTRRALR